MPKTPYSEAYDPTAPVLPLRIASPGDPINGESHLALIDTGADGTFVPVDILESLDLPVIHLVNVRAHLGDQVFRAAVHKVDLIFFDSIRFPNIDVVSDDWGNEIVLGRNILNKLSLHLDGPRGIAELFE